MSSVNVKFDLAFLLLLSFVPHGMYGTPQIKLPTKSSLQHTLGLQTRARNLNKNYCVPTEDVKLLRRNLRACLQEVTSSFRWTTYMSFLGIFFKTHHHHTPHITPPHHHHHTPHSLNNLYVFLGNFFLKHTTPHHHHTPHSLSNLYVFIGNIFKTHHTTPHHHTTTTHHTPHTTHHTAHHHHTPHSLNNLHVFMGIFFFKTHHIESDIKMRCKTVLEKCILKLTNQEEKYSLFSSLLLWYSY